MGICCTKFNKCASFNGALHPSLEQWQAQRTCQLCQLNEVAGCICDACQKSASLTPRYGENGFLNGGSCHDAELHQAIQASRSDLIDCDDRTHFDPMQSDHLTKHELIQSYHPSKCDLGQGHNAPGDNCTLGYDVNMESDGITRHNYHATKHNFLLRDTHKMLFEPDDEMLPSRTHASSSKEGQDVVMFNNIAAQEFLSNSMRLARSVDDSDGIKLEVRYKHMFPHDVQKSAVNCVSLHEDHVFKRTRSSEKLLAGDAEANRSIRRRKSFEEEVITSEVKDGFNGEVMPCKHLLHITTREESKDVDIDDDDENVDDDDFLDFTVGESISSLHSDPGYMGMDLPEDSEHRLGMYSSHQSDDKVPMNMNQHVQDGFNYVMNHVGVLNLDVSECNQPVYVLSKENMQFISREERAWEVRAEAMGMEDKVSRRQALSVVSTGDAILFSGADSDEFHLIPSMFVQHPKSPVSSPLQNFSPPRLMMVDEPEKSVLSVEDIILLLENDKLGEDDIFSLFIDSCTKSSTSVSPTSPSSSPSLESSMIWSSPLLSSSSSSGSSLSSSTSSTLSSSTPWLPSSSTSMLQLPPSSTTYSLSLPYSLSLRTSCKKSPHASFEFKVKLSQSSMPSTPVFSPMRSRTKRNIAQLKPNARTSGDLVA